MASANLFCCQRSMFPLSTVKFSVPNRAVRPALGTAGLWESGFPKQKPDPAWVTCRPQVCNPNLNL